MMLLKAFFWGLEDGWKAQVCMSEDMLSMLGAARPRHVRAYDVAHRAATAVRRSM